MFCGTLGKTIVMAVLTVRKGFVPQTNIVSWGWRLWTQPGKVHAGNKKSIFQQQLHHQLCRCGKVVQSLDPSGSLSPQWVPDIKGLFQTEQSRWWIREGSVLNPWPLPDLAHTVSSEHPEKAGTDMPLSAGGSPAQWFVNYPILVLMGVFGSQVHTHLNPWS